MKTAEDIINEKERHAITVPPDATIAEALRIMLKQNIGAILIEEKGEITGIWTERDLMRNSIADGFDPRKERVGDHMSSKLLYAPHDATIFHLLDKFLGLRVRHLLIEKNGKFIGMLSTGDVVRANLVQKTQELKELSAFLSWEYYENWKWDRGKHIARATVKKP